MIDLEQVSCSFYGDDTQVINKAIYLYHGVTLSASFLFSSPDAADYDRVNEEIDETASWKDRVRTCSSWSLILWELKARAIEEWKT